MWMRWIGGLLALALCATRAVCASDQPARPRSILVLGDSLAAGYGLDPAQAYPAVLQQKITAAGWRFTVLNAGVSGDTTAGGLRRLDWLLRSQPDVLIIALGGNDGLRGIAPAATKANLQGIIDRARTRSPRIRIVLAGMRMPPNLGAEYTARFAAIFPELARTNQVAFVPFLLEGVGGRPAYNQADLIHPTAAGQRVVAENVWRVLRPILEQFPAAP